MSETPEPKTHFEKRQALYERLDRKVQAAQTLFDGLYALPTLSVVDADEEAEKSQLDSLFEQTLKWFPQETQDRYKRYNYLFLHDIKRRTEQSEYESLGADSDVMFLHNSFLVVSHAQSNRGLARSVLAMIGQAGKDQEKIREVLQFFGIQPIDRVKQIVPGRFSIHVLLDEESFRNYKAHTSGRVSLGSNVHSIWNLINDGDRINNDQARALGITPAESRRQTLEHEDAHALIEPFLTPEFTRSSIIANIQYGVQTLSELQITEQQRRVQRVISRFLRRLIDYPREEMIVENISAPTRRIPQTTFVHLILDNIEALQPLIDQNSAVAHTQDVIAHIGSTIQRFYQLVETPSPEHLRDLQFALAIIPISDWKHIKGLINYWGTKTNQATSTVP